MIGIIITKPLQFMIAASIIPQLGKEDVSLLVSDTFAGAKDFFVRYQNCGSPWGEMLFFEHPNDAYRYAGRARFDMLLIDSDVGSKKMYTLLRLKIASPKTEVYTYEEGIGTYRNDLYIGVKRWILSRLGVGTEFGGSTFTTGIFVYDPDRYRSMFHWLSGKPVSIETDLSTFISQNMPVLVELFEVPDFCVAGTKDPCSIYLTDWDVDQDFVNESLLPLPGRIMIKPHPHIRDPRIDFAGVERVEVLPSGAPFEVLLSAILEQHPDTTVFHHGSTAAHYMRGTPARFVKI